MHDWGGLSARLTSREVVTFLGVGGIGYVVDMVAFNLLLSAPGFAGHDPTLARVAAVAVAMVVTYLGNRFLTWRSGPAQHQLRHVVLFVAFNLLGLGFSVLTLVISYDLLDLTSRLADNISTNGVGVALGTAFRYWGYRRFVFAPQVPDSALEPDRHTAPPDRSWREPVGAGLSRQREREAA